MVKVVVSHPGETVLDEFDALVAKAPPLAPAVLPPKIGWIEIEPQLNVGVPVLISDTAPAAPLNGTLWWESDSGALYLWYDDGSSAQWVEVGGGGGDGGVPAGVMVSDTAPTPPVPDGTLWWNSSNGNLYAWYNDGDSAQWVQVNMVGGAAATTPQQYGAKGDGVTDDTAALQAAINSGRSIILPDGVYRTTAPLVCANAVSITGSGWKVSTGLTPNVPNGGSWLYFDHTGEGIYLRDDAAVGASKRMAYLRDFGIKRNQPAPGAGWAPTASGADIRNEFCLEMHGLLALCSTNFLYCRSGGVVRSNRTSGQVFGKGFDIERSPDTTTWTADHWWPFWSTDANVLGYQIANTVIYNIRRQDGLTVLGPFAIYCKQMFKCQDVTGDGGGMSGLYVFRPYADQCGQMLDCQSDFYAAYGSIVAPLCNADISSRGTGAMFRFGGAVGSRFSIDHIHAPRSNDEIVLADGPHRLNVGIEYGNGWSYTGATKYGVDARNGAIVNFLQEPYYTTGTRTEQIDATSDIYHPTRAANTKAAVMLAGQFAGRLAAATDAVTSIAIPSQDKTALVTVVPLSVPATNIPAGTYWVRCTASPSAAIVAQAAVCTQVTVATGVPTGTTGPAGGFRINAANDGRVYFENRSGVSLTFLVSIVGR